jgi:glyoxalase family protein
MLELVSPSDNREEFIEYTSVWKESPVDPKHAIRGFHSATVSEEGYERTASLLADVLKCKHVAKNDKEGRFRFQAINKDGEHNGALGVGSTIDILCQPDTSRGYVGIGTVHHIAWRASDDRHQLDLRERIINEACLNPTPVIDRTYFHSVYFREPGGILFEIATDPPGFTIDEKPGDLGKQLRLPEWLEPMRGRLEQVLPPLSITKGKVTKNRQKESVA